MIDFNKYFIVGTNSDALHDTMNGIVIGELIRCKDCKFNPRKIVLGCPMAGSMSRNDDSFCSVGKRRKTKDTTEEVRKQLKDMEQRREMDRKK